MVNISKKLGVLTMKKCVQCEKSFKEINIIDGKKIRLQNRDKCLECLPYKSKKNRATKRIELKCKNCDNLLTKTETEYKRSNNHFCSRSCAATYNNKHINKKILTKKCKNCKTLIYASNVYCPECIKKGRHLTSNGFIENNYLSDYQHRSDSNRYRSIRDHAKKITSTRTQKCHICNYNKHVETCHIKDIKDFSLNTKIKEINNPSNLILLCSNHHWELDHKILSILKWTLSDSD